MGTKESFDKELLCEWTLHPAPPPPPPVILGSDIPMFVDIFLNLQRITNI